MLMTPDDQTIPTRWERLLPLGGIAYAALLVAAAAAFPVPPGSGDDATARHPAWLATHQTGAALQGYVRAAAALAFLALVLAVARTVARHTGSRSAAPAAVLLGGGLYAASLIAAQSAGIAAAIASHEHAAGATVAALGFLQDGLLALSSLPAMVMFAAAGGGFLAHTTVPRWLAWVTLAGVPLALLDAASSSGSPLEPVGILGLAYFLVWSLATGATLLRPAS